MFNFIAKQFNTVFLFFSEVTIFGTLVDTYAHAALRAYDCGAYETAFAYAA